MIRFGLIKIFKIQFVIRFGLIQILRFDSWFDSKSSRFQDLIRDPIRSLSEFRIRFEVCPNLSLVESFDSQIRWFDWHWLYPPKRDTAYIQYVPNCLYFYIILVRKHIWHFEKILVGEEFFETFKMFHPPKGDAD